MKGKDGKECVNCGHLSTTAYRTTTGTLQWDESASSVEWADDPVPLVSSAIGELRFSVQPILWFWRSSP